MEEASTTDSSVSNDQENYAPKETPVQSKLPVSSKKRGVSSRGKMASSGRKGINKPLTVVNKS